MLNQTLNIHTESGKSNPMEIYINLCFEALMDISASFTQLSQDFSRCAKITHHVILLQDCHFNVCLIIDDLPIYIRTLLLLGIGET